MTSTQHDVREEKRLDARARGCARRAGLTIRKSRSAISLDNWGGYMVFDTSTGFPLEGYRYDMSAEAVIEFCSERT